MLEHEFSNPADWCRGTDFWMLNDELSEQEMCRQLRSMHEQGVGSVIVRTYIGLRSDYPGQDWMAKMRAVVAEAKKIGMKLFMQAGYMPEAVLGLPEKYYLGNLCCFPAGQGQGTKLDSHNEIDYCLTPSERILDMLNPEACAFYVQQSYENIWKDFKEEYGKTIISVWVDEPSFRKVSLPWTADLPSAYEQLWEEAFPMDKIHLLFTDGEGAPLFRLRYWRTVLHLMKNSYFKSVRDWCNDNHLMFSGHLMGEDTMEGQIRCTCFTMPMYQYFDVPGIDYLTAQMEWNHGEIKPEKYYDYMWYHFGYYNTPLQCSSVAHQTGKTTVLAEMYGVSTENLGFRDQKYMFDRLASFGVNHRSVHGIFYSLRGRGKRAYPPHVNDYQPYWPKYHLLTNTIARESAFLRAGQPVKDVLVLHPIETGFSLYHGMDEKGEYNNHTLHRYDQEFNELLRNLAGMQINFELGDEDTIAERGSITEEGFCVGLMTYRAVIIPRMKFIRHTTLALLQEFQKQGGHILVIGEGPEMTDTGTSIKAFLEGIEHVDSTRKLENALMKMPLRYRFKKRNYETAVQILMRQENDDLLFFLMNTDFKRHALGKLEVDGAYSCQRFQEYDGTVETYPSSNEDDKTVVTIDMPEGSSLLLRFQKGAAKEASAPSQATLSIPLANDWTFKRNDPNALVLEMYHFARENEEISREAYPIAAIQSILQKEEYIGDVTLETSFELAKEMTGLFLSLEHPKQQQLELDGEPISNQANGTYRAFGFETIPLDHLKEGIHKLTIRRRFEALRKATMNVTSLFENLGGVELEPAVLLGDFAVRSSLEPAVSGCIRMSKDFVLTNEDTGCGEELIPHGYPFYCGTMTMETQIEIPQHAEHVTFSLDGLNAAVAEVSVNGMHCGELCWAPYSVELTGLQPGKNTLTLKLYGTIRNLLGPWHRPVGEVGACWSGYAAPNQPWEGSLALENRQTYPDWYLDRVPDRPGWTESYLCLPFGIAGATLHCR